MTTSPEFVALADFGLGPGAELLTRAFADYWVKLAFTPERLLEMVRRDSVDLVASRVAVRSGTPVGVALVARRGWTSRLAGMALVPEARRQGVGKALVTRVLDDAKLRGERAMMLEVIEQNEPAVALYRACGFTQIRRLVGFSGSGEGDRVAADALSEIDVRTAGARISEHAPSDIPWQLSGETIAQLGPPCVAYQLDGAWIALANISDATVSIRALIAERNDLIRACNLLRGVIAKFPGKTWSMPSVWPEEWSALFSEAKIPRIALSQWQMRKSLVATS